jgi:hypothetical protein
VLEYPAKRLAAAVDRVKQELSQGFTVAAGVLSGICDDKPDVGCARKLRQEGHEGQIWSLCPEHWLLLLAHDAAGGVDTFLFWDSSQASAIHTRGHLRFGLLEYDRETPRLSTARAAAGADRMVVNGEGMHLAGYPSLRSQKRFQVLQLSSTAPCAEWPGADRCGDYDENARFVPEACKIVPL